MKWVTRSFPGVDRTASAWLIKKFIDPDPEFVFIDWPEESLKPEHGTPFDIEGVKFGHREGKCTFEVLMEEFKVGDPHVREIARLVHAADIKGGLEEVPEARILKEIFTGLRMITENDYETLEVGMKIWESIYAALKLKGIQKARAEELKGMGRTRRLKYLKELLMKEIR